MSLRLRLSLVIFAVVAVMGVVSLVSYQLNRRIEGMVADLARTSTTALAEATALGQSFSIEGTWNGGFVASEIERLPRSRRPQLRGSLQSVDPSTHSVTIHGQVIALTERTSFEPELAASAVFERLAPGLRVEVSCQVAPDGTWLARKFEYADVKGSDKIKGRVTALDLDSSPLRSLVVEGLPISVPVGVEVTYAQGPLYRMEVAGQMKVAIEEGLAGAQELLKLRYLRIDFRARNLGDAAAALSGTIEDAETRLGEAPESFAHYLSESLETTRMRTRSARDSGALARAEVEERSSERWLQPLEAQLAVFVAQVSEFTQLARSDPDAAQTYLQDVLQVTVNNQIEPRVSAYMRETEGELAGDLDAIALRARTASRQVMLANIIGVLLAVTSGLLLSRAISRPVLALRDAAAAVGRGELETSVAVHSKDEFGELAQAFNRMSARLAATTVSIGRLDNVIDSMAGALLIVDAAGCITSVNPAALELLGYASSELLGRPLTMLCPAADGATTGEREFRRKDGSQLPVSFARANLRDQAGDGGGFVCLALDLTERKRMEEELRRSLAEKVLLLREVHHRVKNNLQVISSILDLQSRTIGDPEVLARFQASQDRIRSMVMIHDQLHHTEDLENIDLVVYIEQLVGHLVQSHVEPPGRIRVKTELEPLRLDLERALACGLIVNELVANSIEHAFAPDESGEVSVACRIRSECVILEVRDSGRGYQIPADSLHGDTLGMSLVRSQARQLGGDLVSDPGAGTSIRVEFPVRSRGEVG